MKLSQITLDPKLMMRVALNDEIVDEYAQAMLDGDKFPAITIFNDGDKNYLVDGFKRYYAHKKNGLEIIDAYHCQEIGVSGMVEAIRKRVGSKPAYLTIDIDVLDPAFAPGTGTPVSGGLSSAQLLMTLNKITDLDFRGMDIVEMAPAYDHADITAIAASTVVQHYLQGLAEKKQK